MVLKCAATGWSFTFSLEFTTYVTHNILFVDLVLLVLKSDELVYLLFYCCITIILRIWLFWEQQHLAALLEVPFSCLTSMPNNIQASDKSCLNKTKQQQKGMKTQCSLFTIEKNNHTSGSAEWIHCIVKYCQLHRIGFKAAFKRRGGAKWKGNIRSVRTIIIETKENLTRELEIWIRWQITNLTDKTKKKSKGGKDEYDKKKANKRKNKWVI